MDPLDSKKRFYSKHADSAKKMRADALRAKYAPPVAVAVEEDPMAMLARQGELNTELVDQNALEDKSALAGLGDEAKLEEVLRSLGAAKTP